MKEDFKAQTTQEKTIQELDKSSFKKVVMLAGRVEKVIQTGGPTIFMLYDGTGNLALKGFVAPGERAYPSINEGDLVKVSIRLEEFNGEIEGDIQKIFKKEPEKAQNLNELIEKRERQKAKVQPQDFLVHSQILEKLKDKIINAATEIRLAIFQNRPVIVRHHNDTDGYCSGFALERAIIPLIRKQHSSEKAEWEYFVRAPSTAPFYEIDDSIRDTAQSLRNVAKFSSKMPLIIIADNGSAPEDLMGIKQAKVHGADVIVIDHHSFDEDVVSAEVLEHVNPHLVGESGSHISAGMLCAEVARFINPEVQNMEQLPALAGYADRIDLENETLMKKYLDIAKKLGYTKQLLDDISLVIEYTSTKLKFSEAREYIEVLFGEPRDKQKHLVELMAPYIRELDKKGLEIAKSNSHVEKIGKTNLLSIDIDATFPGFGFFPKPGRAVGLVHDYTKSKGYTSLISVGIMGTAMTFRATDEANFSMHKLIQFLNEKLPNAFVEGGGHKNAGAINFLPNKKEEVLNLVKEFIKHC